MKLYKFRSLGNCEDLERAQEILKTGKFWCSRFWELNDPMEGVYWFSAGTLNADFISRLYNSKSDHALCSFSGEEAFKRPIMWGYYANGFKGIAIEIEVEDDLPSIVKMTYSSEVARIGDTDVPTDGAVKRILTTKLCSWQHEQEYRYLASHDHGKRQIGCLTAVYFGNPYKTAVNAKAAQQRDPVREYLRCVKSLRKSARDKRIPCRQVDIVDCRVREDPAVAVPPHHP